MIEKDLSGAIHTLDWDSRFFGYPIGRIETTHLSSQALRRLIAASRKKFRLIYWFVDPSNSESNRAARESDGLLVDEKVTYFLRVPRRYRSKEIDRNICSYKGKLLNSQLELLAIQSGIYSRFRLDPHFINNEFENLFKKWIERSLNGDIAKEVLVYLLEGKEAGLMTLGEKIGRSDIGLLAVDEKYRGRDIGKKLIEAAFIQTARWGYPELQVVTQKANKIACRFYENTGFKLENSQNVYHFWL